MTCVERDTTNPKKLVYLDTNVIVELEAGNCTLDALRKVVDSTNALFPYSAAHIEEAKEIRGTRDCTKDEYVKRRLTTIRQVSQNFYLYHDLSSRNVVPLTEEPIVVWHMLTDVPFATRAMKLLVNLIPEFLKSLIRKKLGIDTKQLNNCEPDAVVEHLSSILTGASKQPMTFLGFIESATSHHPQAHTFGLSNRMAAVFELLNFFGYWKDVHTKRSNFARLWDSNHAFFAAHCDYFISNDRRTRKKAKVAYSIFGIPTRICSADGKT